jgi:hypothetical protein
MDKSTKRPEHLEHWRRAAAEWRTRGSSQVGFCCEPGLHAWQSQYWLKRVSEEDVGASPAFAGVPTPVSGLRLRFPGGAVVGMEPDLDELTLRPRLVLWAVSAC